jgi:DNA-binding transcriptional LysR family regulator
MDVTFTQVRCFVAVAEELHFGRAAQRLLMTQPPLSRQIQKLEHIVGARLLERDNRQVALTLAGHAFLEDAYRLLNTVDQAVEQARRVEAGSAGTLHLGFTAVSAIGLLGPVLKLLDREVPDMEVVLHERVTASQVEGISRGELDIGLARAPFDTSILSSRIIVREPLYAAVPLGHRLADINGPLRPEDLDGQSVISYHPIQARYFHELTVRYLVNAQARIEQRVQQVLTALLLVAAGKGVAFVPATARLLGVPGVTYKELVQMGDHEHASTDPMRPVELHAIWRRGVMTPLLRNVLQQLDAAGASLGDSFTT